MSEVPRDDQNRSPLSALCGSDCRFWVVFDAIADGIFISDSATGRFIEINQPGCRIFGYSKSELIGLKIEALSSGVHPYTQDMAIERIETARLEGPQTFEWRCKTKDEVLFWAEISIHCTEIDHTLTTLAIVRYITKHKREEQAQRNAALYARSLIEASLDPLSVIGRDGKITDVNEATVQITGLPREAIIGSDATIYVTEPEYARAGIQEVLAKRFLTNYPITIRHASGKMTDVLYNGSIYRDENSDVAGIVITARDITEQKRAERALERLNRTLRTLSAASAAVVRATTEEELLKDMCRVGVEVGGYRLAWIGFVEQDVTKTVRPVAWAGEHPEFVQTAKINWAETERGLGPTGTAIRTGEAQINQDITANPIMAPWRADMLRCDFKASVALPLKHKSEVLGSITLYAGEADAFGPEEVTLRKVVGPSKPLALNYSNGSNLRPSTRYSSKSSSRYVPMMSVSGS
jgi:PAS domain S-box-containing protein